MPCLDPAGAFGTFWFYTASNASPFLALLGVTVIHRHGRLTPGENIVLVVTTSSHRETAFAAAEFLMDYLKIRAPFWKNEERAEGAGWVEARQIDAAAAERWTGGRAGREAAE